MFQVLRKFLDDDPGAATAARRPIVRHADAEGLNWLVKTAEQGDAKAQNNLGFMYDVGLGVRQDDAEARRWYSRAAAQGDAKALHNLGLMSDMSDVGHGVPHDVPRDATTAPGWYWKAGSLPHRSPAAGRRAFKSGGPVAIIPLF